MNKKQISVLILIAFLAGALLLRTTAQDRLSSSHEYVTIRWDGREDSHVIRPSGKVEFIGMELRKLPRPEKADERAFYLNAAMNGLAKEGREIAAMTEETVVMRRAPVR